MIVARKTGMKKILLVDDEPGLLTVMQRSMQKHFSIETACGPLAGLEALKHWQDFSVVVSDMRMPEMTGIEFLSKVKEIAPDIVRIMLTANIDQGTAIEAVNKGSIFRFLNKPCTPDALAETLAAGVRQHQLLIAERDLLESTVRGSVKMLTEILALADPVDFGRAQKVRDYMRDLAAALNVQDTWEFEVAALLSHIGLVTIPAEAISKLRSGQELTHEEQRLFQQIPAISGRLLSEISRFENVSKILLYQKKHFDGSGDPRDEVAGSQIPLGSRMLGFLSDFVELESEGKSRAEVLGLLRRRAGNYDPRIIEAFGSVKPPETESLEGPKPPLSIRFALLRTGNVLRADVFTPDGVLICKAGNRITATLIERLRNFHRLSGIKEPILVDP